MQPVHKYGLERRATYDELVAYLNRGGEPKIRVPERKGITTEFMNPFLSAWKIQQQAMQAKRQAELAYWAPSTSTPGDAPPKDGDGPFDVGKDDPSDIASDVASTIGDTNERVQQAMRGGLTEAAARAYEAMRRQNEMRAQHHLIFDGDTETASVDEHWADAEGFDLRRPPDPPDNEDGARQGFLGRVEQGLRAGALGGAAARAGQLARGAAGTFAETQGMAGIGTRVVGAAAENLAPFEQAIGTGVADVALGALGVAEAPVVVPVALGVGGALLAAAGIGAVSGALGAAPAAIANDLRLVTGDVAADFLHTVSTMGVMGLELQNSGQDLVNRLWQSGAASSTDPPIPIRDLGSLNGQPALGPGMMIQADPTVDPRAYETQRAAMMPTPDRNQALYMGDPSRQGRPRGSAAAALRAYHASQAPGPYSSGLGRSPARPPTGPATSALRDYHASQGARGNVPR